MNIYTLTVMILIIQASTNDVKTTDKCTCEKIKSQTDCLTLLGCQWIATAAGTCTKLIAQPSTVVTIANYCSMVVEPDKNCAKTIGCAYFDQKCIPFSGCRAYSKTTNAECQQISILCTSDWTVCINAILCSDNQDKLTCVGNSSISGARKCKWDTNTTNGNEYCRDYTCSEGEATMATDAQCNDFLSGCVTTGKGCHLSPKPQCKSYLGGVVECAGMIGSDGNCEGVVGSLNCRLIPCDSAPITLSTDAGCSKFQLGCVTSGKGCVASPLPACLTYKGDNVTCVGYIGSDGVCEGDVGGIVCRSRLCHLALASNNTDQLCQEYRSICKTTGKGCVSSRGPCAGYTGTLSTCLGLIGSDGYCKGISDTINNCTLKVCYEAATSMTTDQQCSAYQIGCLTNGKGCVNNRQSCTSYTGTITTCDGYIGTEGQCRGVHSTDINACVVKVCNDAPLVVSTNAQCNTYQTNCLSNDIGCISPTTCLNTIKEISCTGTAGCNWNKICVSNLSCADFYTPSICNANYANPTATNQKCYWTGVACRVADCTDAPISYNSDALCNSFMTGCLTNGGIGCLSPTAPCNAYRGTRLTCANLIRKCWNTESAIAQTYCIERTCSDDITSTTDASCDIFKSGCRTKGTGCIDGALQCSSYSGNSAQCDNFKGLNGTIRCWGNSPTVVGQCINKTCAHSPSSLITDADCESFLTGCLTTLAGCVDKSATCTSYSGTQMQCNQFRALNGTQICWNQSAAISSTPCTVKQCSDAPLTLTTDQDCSQFMKDCRTNGGGCTSPTTPCSQYNGNSALCLTFIGNNIKCYKLDNCADRVCSDKQNVISNQDCMTYLSSCRLYNGTCIVANTCSNYASNQLTTCIDTMDNSVPPQKCWWVVGALSCTSRTCDNAPSTVTDQAGCDNHTTGCKFIGSVCLQISNSCFSYNAQGIDEAAKRIYCAALSDITNNKCQYISGLTCQIRTCQGAQPNSQQDCDAWISGCLYNNYNQCVTKSACTSYSSSSFPSAVNSDALKAVYCGGLTDNGTIPQKCTYSSSTTSNCIARTCSTAISMTSQADCNAWMTGCQWNQNNLCQPKAACTTYLSSGFPTAANTDILKAANCQLLADYSTPTTPWTCTYPIAPANCILRTCDNATSIGSQSDCDTWVAGCLWDSGTKCYSKICTNYKTASFPSATTDAQKVTQCGLYFDNSTTPQKCHYIASISTISCIPRTCDTATSIASQANCDSWMTGCIWDQGTKCLTKGICTSYQLVDFPVTATSDSLKATFCGTLTDNAGSPQKCHYLSTNPSSCVARKCSDATGISSQANCNTWMAGCQWDQGTKCLPKGACTTYLSSGFPSSAITDAQKETYCALLTDDYTTPQTCHYVAATTTQSCVVRYCKDATGISSQANCNSWRPGCQWDQGTKCLDLSTCTSYLSTGFPAGANTDSLKAAHCALLLNKDNSTQCHYVSTNTTSCVARTCENATSITSQANCNSWITGCLWDQGTKCLTKSSCTSYQQSGFPVGANTDQLKATHCGLFTDNESTPQKCTYPLAPTSCIPKTCDNAGISTSQASCDAWVSGCIWDQQTKCLLKSACTTYLTISFPSTVVTDTQKENHCALFSDVQGQKCHYLSGIPKSCSARTCSNLNAVMGANSCDLWMNGCIWDQGTKCLIRGACTSYTSTIFPLSANTDTLKAAFCGLLSDNSTNRLRCHYLASSSTTNCIARTCSNAPTPQRDTDCKDWASDCNIQRTAIPICIINTSNCSVYQGTLTQCRNTIGQDGACWNNTATDIVIGSCRLRQCTDNVTASTDAECVAFIAGCKTNGFGCVATNVGCTSLQGTSTSCNGVKATDNQNYCKFGTSNAGSCYDKQCYQDNSSTTDSQCQTFLVGCLTRGVGCIPSTEPCTKYYGPQSACSRFTGNGRKCWNATDATMQNNCIDRQCSHDLTSFNDTLCGIFLTGCLSKGVGCIDPAANCNAYYGTQQQCIKFTGTNGTKPCWNTQSATSQTACIDRQCIQNTSSTTNAECELFMPRMTGSTVPRCVSTHIPGCYDYPRSCLTYMGTQDQCSKFIASDGPCKSSVIGSNSAVGQCTPRICIEAMNTNTTDALCAAYHPTCKTNGFGCVAIVQCLDIVEIKACSVRSGCSWVSNCRSIVSDCSTLTPMGSSVCMNTPASTGFKKCTWAEGICRAQQCDDLPATLNTHELCQKVSSTCTTKGAGCITITICINYLTENICKAARTNQPGDTCIWDRNVCRNKQCTDAPANTTTDSGCDIFLKGCKSNGTSCVAADYKCQSIITQQQCIKDGNNRPCLWADNACYNYTKCEDIYETTHTRCQKFHTLCTTNGRNCISITKCSLTQLQVSCVKGTDGVCGWLPSVGNIAAKCQQFKQCAEAQGTQLYLCQFYGSNCISDGSRCLDKGLCSGYLTKMACESNGTDGICVFVDAQCRLRECIDATTFNASTLNTHNGCVAFEARTKCTTNGSTCINYGLCASYTVEAGCVEGIDGLCIYDYPVGQIVGFKSCRVKVCSDFKLTTSAACSVALTGVGLGTGCVSNGSNCIVKSGCATYTTREACSGGGTDQICAFTAGITNNVGICKLMTQCSDAVSDELACKQKPKVCQWVISASSGNKCIDHTCTSLAVGSDCNPVPNFDGSQYSICIVSGATCIAGNGSSLSAQECYKDSMGTYTWNGLTTKCEACFDIITDGNDVVDGSVSGWILIVYGLLVMVI